jgi:hypothetical protein
MKPPFWEVTISRRVVAGKEPTIESVNCFADRIAAEEYANQALREDTRLLIAMRHVDEIAPLSESVVVGSTWVQEEAKEQPQTLVLCSAE